MFTSYCFSSKIIVNLYRKGWQFSCHLIAGINAKDLSPANVYPTLFKYENKCKFIQKIWAVQLPPKIGRHVKDLSLENVHLILF